MPSRSHRPVAPDKALDASGQLPSMSDDVADGETSPMPLSTQVPLFRASQLEAVPPRPRRRLAGLKTLLGALDTRRSLSRAAKPGATHDPLRLRTDLWLDSFFDD
jgi:hypothetical protein